MYRVMIICWMLAACSNGLSGQADKFDPGRLHIGITAGFNAVAIHPQTSYGQNLMAVAIPVRPAFGLASQFHLNRRSYLQIDAVYQQMGMRYDDFISGRQLSKDIRNNYFVVPVMYKLVLNPYHTGYDAAATFSNTKWYLMAGLQPGFLTSSSVRHEINGQLTDFVGFITAGDNPNEGDIRDMEPPASDEELYQSFDLSAVGGAGFFTRFSPRWMIFLELRGGFSIFDINAEDWRLPNPSGNYFAARNLFFGIHAGIAYRVF